MVIKVLKDKKELVEVSYNDKREVTIKIEEEELIGIIIKKDPRFDEETASLFISCYTEATDNVYDQYPYSQFLSESMILAWEEMLQFFALGEDEFWDYKSEVGLGYSVDRISRGKNKDKYLVIEGL